MKGKYAFRGSIWHNILSFSQIICCLCHSEVHHVMKVKLLANVFVLNCEIMRCLIISEICCYGFWKMIVFNILSGAEKAQATNLLAIESFLIFREDRSTVK